MQAFGDRQYSWLRWILAVTAFVLPAAVLHAALSPEQPDITAPPSLAGQLLIAAPEMSDPFDHAVILMAQHNRDGALGIIINHPLATRPIASLLEALGAEGSGVTGNVPIFLGGPVSATTAFVIHSADYRRDDTLDIDGRVALSDAVGVLGDIAGGKGPAKSSGHPRLCRLGAVAARRRNRPRRLGHGAGKSATGVRRRPHESVDRRDGAAQNCALVERI